MANATPVMQQDPKGPQGGTRMSKPVELPPELVSANVDGSVADPDSPPAEGAVHGNPPTRVANAGTPDDVVYEYSKSVRGMLSEVHGAPAVAPQAVYELPGGAIRTDH